VHNHENLLDFETCTDQEAFFANYFKTCFVGGKETMSKCKFTVKVFITVTSDGKAPTILLNGFAKRS
jgi:hypothetical protein